MTAVRSRALLWLPPVAVALALGFVVSRAATRRGDREPLERSIRAHWEVPDEAAAVEADIARYQKAYGSDPAARWFAAEAWIRVGRLGKALDAVWPEGTKAAEDDPESARRFALLVLSILGGQQGDASTLGPLSPRTLQARIEAGDPNAAGELIQAVSKMTFQQLPGFYLSFVRSPTRAVRALADGLNQRTSEPDVLALAATLPPSPSDGPALELLLDRLDSPWRFGRRGPWQYVVRALGASTSPRALAALRTSRNAVAGANGADVGPTTRQDLDGGLAIAGDADAIRRVEEETLDGKAGWLAEMYVGGLLARVWSGDAEAGTRLTALYDKSAIAGLQLQIAYGMVFADGEPPPTVPVDRFAEAVGMSREPMQRVVSHAWALRKGRPGAREALLEDVRTAPEGQELRGLRVEPYGPLGAPLEALRALARWSVPLSK